MLGGQEVWASNNVMRLFSFLYNAASHTHVHYFCFCILLVVIYICYFLEHVALMFFSLKVKNVREYCKEQ